MIFKFYYYSASCFVVEADSKEVVQNFINDPSEQAYLFAGMYGKVFNTGQTFTEPVEISDLPEENPATFRICNDDIVDILDKKYWEDEDMKIMYSREGYKTWYH